MTNTTDEDIKDMRQRLENAKELFTFLLENAELDSCAKERINEYLVYETYVKTMY